MILVAVDVAPRVVFLRILHHKTVLVSGDVVWLPDLPIGIRHRGARILIRPNEGILFIFIISASIKAEFANAC